jgi:hypothetical protein
MSERGTLPDALSFRKGYEHLSTEELNQVKNMVASQAAFFMTGKYPKAIHARNPVKIDTGTAQPRAAGYRRLNEEEQRVVTDYVENLIEADVVEPCGGPDTKEGWRAETGGGPT